MTGRSRLLGLTFAACVLVAVPAVAPLGKRLVLNTTASAPLGFYWLGDDRVGAGDLALVRPPNPLARWMAQRRYLPLNVPLIKRIAAVDGQVVCITAGAVFVDGQRVASVLQHDLLGRALTPSTVCRRLRADEVFLMNGEPRSLDSRYFGPLSRHCVLGRLTPLWTWER